MSRSDILIADIGGTNARFAFASDNGVAFELQQTLQCADYASAYAAITHYLNSVGAPSPKVMCFGAAGPVTGHTISLTNNDWKIDVDELIRRFAVSKVFLLNDFDAVAYSLPLLSNSNCISLGGPESTSLEKNQYTVAVVGPGTGLGTAALCKEGRFYLSIGGEAGFSGFAAENDLQSRVAATLREKFQRVAAEHVLSGPGLQNIYWALSRMHGNECQPLSAEEIGQHALLADNALAVEATGIFFEILGQYAGDIALTFGADDGVFVAGGIAKRYPDMLLRSSFRAGFENKSQHRALMKRIPTMLITLDEPGLLGAAHYARLKLQS